MIASDPGFSVAPGDPGAISQAAAWHQELADAFELHQATIAGAASSVLATWNGEAASSYGQLSTIVGNHFGAAALTSRAVAGELGRYSAELERCQHAGTVALHEAEYWLGQQNLWQGKLDAANRAITAAQAQISAAQSTLSNPLMTGPFMSAVQGAAQSELTAGRAALTKAQDDQRTATRELHHAQQQAMLWQARGRRAWQDAIDAADQATGFVGGIQITPPPLAGWAVPDRFNTPPPVTHHHSGGGFFGDPLGTLGHLAADAGKLALGEAGGMVSSSLPGLILRGASALSGTTLGWCVGGGFTVGHAGGSGSICWVATPGGGTGMTVTAGGGGSTGTLGVNGSTGPLISNGNNLGDQGGWFTYAGASGGEGLESGGATVSWGYNGHGRRIVDANPVWSPGVGDPVNLHGGRSYTWTVPSTFGP